MEFDFTKKIIIIQYYFFSGWIIQIIFDTEDHLISGSEDATIRLWHLVSGDIIHVIPQDSGISCLTVSKLKGKENDILLFGDRDGKMSYLDFQTLLVRNFVKHKKY